MSILSAIFARKGDRFNPETPVFRLFSTVGSAREIRRAALQFAMGNYECLRIHYLGGYISKVRVIDGTVQREYAIPDGCRADFDWDTIVSFGEGGCDVDFSEQNRSLQNAELPLSASEFRYVNGLMVQASSNVAGYAERTVPVLEKMRQHYAGRVYRLQNLRFTPADLQCLCTNMALGRLPRSLMCYHDSHGCSATVPENPEEGAEILAAPLDRTIARFSNGAWVLYETTDMQKGEFMIDSEILMYIGRKPVRNAAKSQKQSA